MTAPTFPANKPARARRGGFTLIELSVALLVLGLIATLALPRLLPDRGGASSRAAAYRIAALLRADRTAAERSGQPVATRVDAGARSVVSGASPDVVRVGGDGRFGLADGGDRVVFRPDGGASGGLVVIGDDVLGYGVAVNAFSGAVDVVRVRP